MTKNLRDLADQIYSKVSGADNRGEHTETVNEIYDWLYNADKAVLNCKLSTLVDMWNEYTAQAQADIEAAQDW